MSERDGGESKFVGNVTFVRAKPTDITPIDQRIRVIRCQQDEYRSIAFSMKRDEPYSTSPLFIGDARRIVALWNNALGIPTAALPQLAALRAENGRLRSALEVAKDACEKNLVYAHYKDEQVLYKAIQVIQQALAHDASKE